MNKKDPSEKNILEKLQNYLSYRAHSEYELKRKLTKHFNDQEITKALQWARKHKWLLEPEEMASQLADELHRKKKGWLFIQAALKKKQLPSVQRQECLEEEKCRWWLGKKFSNMENYPGSIIQKIYRFLSYRGFEEFIIKKIVHEYTHR